MNESNEDNKQFCFTGKIVIKEWNIEEENNGYSNFIGSTFHLHKKSNLEYKLFSVHDDCTFCTDLYNENLGLILLIGYGDLKNFYETYKNSNRKRFNCSYIDVNKKWVE